MKPVLFLAAALSIATAAQAQEAKLRYADLNLSTAAGQAELERRIESAARQVCRAETATGTRIANMEDKRRCEEDVRAQITARLPH